MKTPIQHRLAKRIKELRRKFNLTQERLAELSGVDYKHVQLLEGKAPPSARIDTIEKLAGAFKITVSTFLKI